ncbi:type I phosphodiesterase/nucleotide pyrophosphatase (macronuclear) [Tetrahymena thermophila SB210]|uniref:Type I phosphodiesterase/nucleotide pyrophosphatase n=1 Tax=Tetrahymena thermophila (strain SB210) TaxID=312017 RepID=I7MKD1_TETTS|nr:type I phosphodiesterase/nucleotide pyrophosphatase [Tetrahymena thermophila SB210]EAR98197.2 type I phosphodiesterase/nucleotide pyrophosphatase [Tetrahymena thermophila SB210]|eukprot:XP_001018442.2 type I phosphodiesterase/nucleotide pyrophosphatase [Tetrahymena thermophila SB210]
MSLGNNPYCLILFITVIYLIGSSTFLYGFTSTAADSNEFSSKANPYVSEMIFKDSEQKAIYEKQWFPTQSDQVLFMIVDGLPYSYVVNEEEQQKKFEQKQAGSNDPSLYIPSRNIPFQVFLNTVNEFPNSTVLLKGFAHPPTYTSTRIKAIVQGNIPTYDQLKSNLGSKEIKSDNIFRQAKINNPFIGQKREKAVCYATHSLHDLYPNIFDRSHFVGEVNFYEKLQSDMDQYQYISKEQLEYDDWSTMLLHFEAIDGFSHLQRTYDNAVVSAIKSVNELVKNIIDNVRNSKKNTDQVILAVSDHGLNFKKYGRHGGYTLEESNSFIYGYSKTEFITKQKKDIGQEMDREFLIGTDTFQINITPTYCMILGIPIPFNNIAMIQPDFFLDKPFVDDFVIANNFYTNFRQVLDSFQNTVDSFDGNIKQLDKINKLGDNLKAKYKQLFEVKKGNTVVNQAKLKEFIQLCHQYSQSIANVIQTDFQEIKENYMLLGLIIHFSLAFLIIVSIATLKIISNKNDQISQISYQNHEMLTSINEIIPKFRFHHRLLDILISYSAVHIDQNIQ